MNHKIYTKQMPLIKVREKAQITLPARIRRVLRINQGDYLQAVIQGSQVVLTPQAVMDRTEAVKLSRQGEQMLVKALTDVKQKRVKEFSSLDALLVSLKK